MASNEVKVPDIGDFKSVEVIEVLVKPGDKVAKEQSLVTLESDKATMEIPSPAAGVVKDADRKGVFDLAHELAEISKKARDGKLAPTDMQGGTFSISSLGGIGGTYFTPIINAPEVAILGVSRAAMKPVWDGKQFAPRLMMPISLSYDHRVIDGATAARFTTFLVSVLSDIRKLIL